MMVTFFKMKTTGGGGRTLRGRETDISWRCLMDLEIKVMNGWLDI